MQLCSVWLEVSLYFTLSSCFFLWNLCEICGKVLPKTFLLSLVTHLSTVLCCRYGMSRFAIFPVTLLTLSIGLLVTLAGNRTFLRFRRSTSAWIVVASSSSGGWSVRFPTCMPSSESAVNPQYCQGCRFLGLLHRASSSVAMFHSLHWLDFAAKCACSIHRFKIEIC